MEVVRIDKNDIGRYIHMLSRQVKRKIDVAVSRYNVTAVQCSFIKFIFDKNKTGNVYAKDIESRFNMRRATVAEILSLMEKNGLIERKSLKVEQEIKRGITEEELQNFTTILEKMLKNIED